MFAEIERHARDDHEEVANQHQNGEGCPEQGEHGQRAPAKHQTQHERDEETANHPDADRSDRSARRLLHPREQGRQAAARERLNAIRVAALDPPFAFASRLLSSTKKITTPIGSHTC